MSIQSQTHTFRVEFDINFVSEHAAGNSLANIETIAAIESDDLNAGWWNRHDKS